MTHFAKFALPLTTVYGKTQAIEGVPESLTSANAIIAANLTYDPNINSTSEPLAGGQLDGNAMVRIADQFAEVSFDSYIPVLGTLFGQQVGVNETAVLLINSNFNEATDSDSLVIGGITMTLKTGQTGTPSQITDNFVKYATGGTPSSTLATYSGTLNPNYTVSRYQVGTSSVWALFFQGILPFTDYTDLATTGSAVATLTKITLDKTQGGTTISNRLPVADFLECSNLFQTIVTTLGLRDTLDQQYKDALTYIANAQTAITQSVSGVTKTKKFATSLSKLNLGDAANTALVNTFISDLNALNAQLNNDTTDSIVVIKNRINSLYADFNAHIANLEYNLAVSDLKIATAEIIDLFTDWLSQFSGTLKIGDSLTFAGKKYLATANTTGVQIADIIVNQGSSAFASQVTISTVNSTIASRWTFVLSASGSNTVKATKVGATATSDKTDLTATYTKIVGSTSNQVQALQTSVAYSVVTIDDNLATYTSDMNAIVNDNPAVDLAFNQIKSDMSQAFAETKVNVVKIPANITALNNSAFARLTGANTTVSSATYTVGDLVPVYKEVVFDNLTSSPDVETVHVRKASADLATTEKTVIITDAKYMVDINIENAKSPMFKFNGHGNIYDIVEAATLTYDIAKQKTNAAVMTTAESIRNASLTPTGSGIYNNNICFNKFSAPNFDGFVHERTLTGCGNFWQATRKSHEFTLTILEEKPDTSDLESFNVEDNLGKEFTFYFEQGLGNGNNFSITMTNCVLKGYKHTSVSSTAAQDLTFECTGSSTLRLF